jgi:hypothetical protein
VIHQFIQWFEETTGETFDPENVTPIDAAEFDHSLPKGRGFLGNLFYRREVDQA